MATMTKKKTKITLRPMGDKVVIERDDAIEITPGGIHIPKGAQEKPAWGTVVAIGPGRILPNGQRSEMQVQEGDRVVFPKYAPEPIELDGVTYGLLNEHELLGVER